MYSKTDRRRSHPNLYAPEPPLRAYGLGELSLCFGFVVAKRLNSYGHIETVISDFLGRLPNIEINI